MEVFLQEAERFQALQLVARCQMAGGRCFLCSFSGNTSNSGSGGGSSNGSSYEFFGFFKADR